MKKLKDTKLGKFLKEKAPKILDVVGDALPEKGVLGIVKNIISNNTDVNDEVKKEFNEKEAEFELELEKLEIEYQKQITERHKTDMLSDSWMSKNIRPYTLVYLLLFLTVIVILDSSLTNFNVNESYITLIETLLVSVFLFYFGGRELTKLMSLRTKKEK